MAICYFDIETVGRQAAEALLREPRPDARLTDAVKITADVEKKRQQDIGKLSLDPYGARIVMLAWHRTGRDGEPIHCYSCPTEDEEAAGLRLLLSDVQTADLCGYNIRAFDLPVIMARCRLLGVPYPYRWDAPKWLRYGSDVLDLFEVVTFGAAKYDDHVISRSLTSMCKVFGLDVAEDDLPGRLVAQAVREGKWDLIAEHCRRDVERVMLLGQKLRVADMRTPQSPTPFRGV